MITLLEEVKGAKVLKKYDELKSFVPEAELWYAFEIPNEPSDFTVHRAVVQHLDKKVYTNLVLYQHKYLISASDCSHNELVACAHDTDFEVLGAAKFGYVDEVDRRKYVSVPIGGYWDYYNVPIVLVK